jgi:2-polyprenyl-6-methoxyphenol hydroxylase-like FAD-dependent oxidoreductase
MSTQRPQTSVLISGAGIAGPALALQLNKNGFKTTIIERAESLRTAGQQIDVTGPGVELIRLMGVEDAIRSRTIGDEGIHFVDNDDKRIATFPASNSTASLVREIEIMRGDMADVFYQATKDQTEYIFGDRITELSESEKGITASFKNGGNRTFDLVVAADGLSSRTREIAFGSSKKAAVKNLSQWVALFLIPHSPSDGTWTRAYHAPGGRVVTLRPDVKRKRTSVYLSKGGDDMSITEKSVEEQRGIVQRTFAGIGWETERVLSHMKDAKDLYVQQVAQVKMPSWNKGRTVLLGDAGYCPSPVSGLGTTMAIVGAYVLAGCLVTHEHDLPRALEQYEADMRPFVDSAQKLAPGVPAIATPQSEWGVWALRRALATVGAAMKVSRMAVVGTVLAWAFWPLSLLSTAFNQIGWLGGVESLPLPRYEKMKGFSKMEKA